MERKDEEYIRKRWNDEREKKEYKEAKIKTVIKITIK